MQKIVLLVCFILWTVFLTAQTTKPAVKPLPTDPAKMTMEDMQRISKMSPQELAAYKEQLLKNAEDRVRKAATAANIKLNESILPTTELKAPVKDIKRLSALPLTPPSRKELLVQTAKMEAALKRVMPAQALQEAEQFSASKPVKEIQNATIGAWYRDNPQGALLMGMKAVQKDPADILGWNNLAAVLNMAGLEHQAVPVLMNCLVEKPDNPMLLNNMGQSYLGMGDLSKPGNTSPGVYPLMNCTPKPTIPWH